MSKNLFWNITWNQTTTITLGLNKRINQFTHINNKGHSLKSEPETQDSGTRDPEHWNPETWDHTNRDPGTWNTGSWDPEPWKKNPENWYCDTYIPSILRLAIDPHPQIIFTLLYQNFNHIKLGHVCRKRRGWN